MIKEHKRVESKKADAWDYILKGKKSLAPKDAAAIRNSLKIFEQE